MFHMLLDTVAPWISNSFPIIRMVLMIIVGLAAICLIIVTLFQSSDNEGGTNVVTGNSYESYYSQNKGGSKDAKLKKATITLSIIITVCVVIYFVLTAIYWG